MVIARFRHQSTVSCFEPLKSILKVNLVLKQLSTTPWVCMGEWEYISNFFLFFFISAVDKGEWSATCPGFFTLGKGPPVLTGQEAGWPFQLWSMETFLSFAGNRIPSVQSVASRCTDFAIPTPTHPHARRTHARTHTHTHIHSIDTTLTYSHGIKVFIVPPFQ
jgi:hypothetical protein